MSGHIDAGTIDYQSLYLGSQASLADMAARQAGALNRVSRLRDGIVLALKQHFPTEFAAAEKAMSSRMSSVEDEVLLAYLHGLLAGSKDPTAVRLSAEKIAVSRALEVLTTVGMPAPDGVDPWQWITKLITMPAPAAPPEPDKRTVDEAASKLDPEPIAVAPATADGGDVGLADLFSDTVPAAEPMVGDLFGLFDGMDLSAPADLPEEPAPLPDDVEEAPPSRREPDRTKQVRPAVFPPAQPPAVIEPKSPRQRKTPRVHANPPADEPGQTTDATPTVLDEAFMNKMLAAVCIPRPVFMSDLVAQVGDAKLVDAWFRECRDVTGPLRFIAPKNRHKARGNLVLPFTAELRESNPAFEASVWGKFLAGSLRGAELYETAIVLHRFAEEVADADIGTHAVVLHVNQRRGRIGVVMARSSNPVSKGDATCKEICDVVERLLSERLTLISVLTCSGVERAVTDLADAVRTEGESRDWAVTTPIVASRSWDFASDGGTSAISVLG